MSVCARVVDFLRRPHYGLRFVSELLLMAVYVCVLSCDDFSAFGVSRRCGVALVASTYAWMVYSLVFCKKNIGRGEWWFPLLIVGRCILTVVLDAILLFLTYVAILRMLANGPEFFADNLSVPDDVDYLKPCEGSDVSAYDDMFSTNCSPFVALSLNGGCYTCYGAVNPGEPGRLRLRVCEVTKGACILDTEKLKGFYDLFGSAGKSCAWSKNKGESFAFRLSCPLSCGRKNQSYLVLVEVWFMPNSNGVGRVLIARNFLVHGDY